MTKIKTCDSTITLQKRGATLCGQVLLYWQLEFSLYASDTLADEFIPSLLYGLQFSFSYIGSGTIPLVVTVNYYLYSPFNILLCFLIQGLTMQPRQA